MYSFALEQHEEILKKSVASLYCDDNAFQGALYLTTERLVFVGHLLDVSNKFIEEIPLAHIDTLSPGKTFYVIPNVLNLTTIRSRRLKILVKERDQWYYAIQERIKLLK